MSDWLEGLNEMQRAAVVAPLGNTLVLAGAGSGKTRVLVSRMAWLIESMNMAPQEILAVTFTNKAANEMRARLSHLLGGKIEDLWVGTFHGLCHRLLRRHYEAAGLVRHFHILDSEDQLRMVKRVQASLNLSDEQWPAKALQAYINGKKDEGLRPQHIQAPSFGPGKTYVSVYLAYEKMCQAAGVIDFAEIILRTFELLKHHPDLLSHYHRRFRAILVDEFQDTNSIQYAWLRLLCTPSTSVMAVGDDDQSIYGWRGARVENIRSFTKDFTDVNIIRLEQNYRSTSIILGAANALISHNQARMGKSLWTNAGDGDKIELFSAFNELEEARFVSEAMREAHREGIDYDEMAVLYRSNAQSRVVEEALIRQQIPYRIHGGLSFFDRAEIKDALAYLRLVVNADDDAAFLRIVNLPTRGIGDKTLDELRQIGQTLNVSLMQVARDLLQKEHFPKRAHSALLGFVHLIEAIEAKIAGMDLDEQIAHVIEASGLMAHYQKQKGDKSESRVENLQELVNAAKEFRYEQDETEPLPLTVTFLTHASLEAGETRARDHESAVHLMTLHAAKGLEFKRVFMVGMEEGLFPSKQSYEDPNRLEEERRLCYVGMTRARERLYFSYAEIRRQYGREEYHKPSRFLQEVPEGFVYARRPVSSYGKQAFIKSAAPAVSTPQESFGLRLGQSVVHAKFGQGIVLSMEGSGANARVHVRFKDGSKWLVLAYANLVAED